MRGGDSTTGEEKIEKNLLRAHTNHKRNTIVTQDRKSPELGLKEEETKNLQRVLVEVDLKNVRKLGKKWLP